MKYEVLLNCEGIKDTDDPYMPKRCQNCVEGSAGTFLLTGNWLRAYLDLINQDLPTNELFDQLNEANIIPRCPITQAFRYTTTAVSIHR